MISPDGLARELPLPPRAAESVQAGRKAVASVLRGEDGRLLLLVGPCSLHDRGAALDYGQRLASLGARVEGKILLVMRAYVEKSRTGLGWRGLAEEPSIAGGRDPEAGAAAARGLLVELASLGLPLGTEIVSPYLWRYWEDCLSWAALGARGVEAQALRETAAALPFPCAFKNSLSGGADSAVQAALVASRPCRFLGLGRDGRASAIEAGGNPLPHLVLRGGRSRRELRSWDLGREPRPNYLASRRALRDMAEAGLQPALLIDASHDNSRPFGQAFAARAAFRLALRGRKRGGGLAGIRGLMLESNLESGCQAPGAPATLRYGVSITDPCLGWAETEALILGMAERL